MANQNVIMLKEDNFRQEVLKSEMPVLVDFWAAWCGPCKMLSPVVEQIESEISDIKVCKINIDDEGELALRYNVMSIPTLMFFKNGEIAGQLIGVHSKTDILAEIEKIK